MIIELLENLLHGIQEPLNTVVQHPFFVKYGLIGLFLNGMLSSVIPIPTEFTATALLLGGNSKESVFLVLAVSSIIGGFLAYYIGMSGNKLFHKLYRMPKEKDRDRGHLLLTKYGWIAIFFCSWVPVLGDVIPIVAGAKKYDFMKFALSMATGKAVKVFAIVYVLAVIVPRLFG